MKNRVLDRMKSEGLTVVDLVEITGISRRTINRFLHGEKDASKRTLEAMQSFIDYLGKYKEKNHLVNLGQIRIPKEHYDYLKRRADVDDVAVVEVVRYIIEQVVENDFLWKAFSEHINITEQAVKNVISNILIPFLRVQDKSLLSLEKQTAWIEELFIKGIYKNTNDPVVRGRIESSKETIFEEVEKKVYKRNRGHD